MTTWHMKIQTVRFAAYSDVDLAANCLQIDRLQFSYSHPAVLTFRVTAPNYTAPLASGAFITLWDSDGTTPDGAPQTFSNPIFEGFIEDVKPGPDSTSVAYTAYDPSHMTAKKAIVMSAAWGAGNVATLTPPSKAIGAVPRLVLNCANDADDDYAFARNSSLGTCAQLIAGIFDDSYHPLYWINAAPGDGSNAGNGSAYVWASELELLTVIPQEKLVHESDTIRSAISQILTRFQPEWRCFWQAGTRKWRFQQLTYATQVTLTFNDPGGTDKILAASMEPTLEGRYGAVEIRGPETTATELFTWTLDGTSNTMGPIGAPVVLETYTDSTGSHSVNAYTAFQITDTTLRRGAKLLPLPYELVDSGNIVSYRGPVLQLSFDGGSTWTSTNTWFDHYNGIAYWYQPIYFYSSESPAGSTQHYFVPNAARLLWAAYVIPITVRSPSSGFVGTASSVGGVTAEYCLYDEALAVGYEYGTPVTTAYRLAQFQSLADTLLAERKDIAWIGQITLHGLQWRFAWLGLRINLTGYDADGNAVTTGWEAINAWLTDVEFDIENNQTILTINADQLQNLGLDVGGLKQRLRINKLEQVEWQSYYSTFVVGSDGLPWMSGVVEVNHFDYVDPSTGRIDSR